MSQIPGVPEPGDIVLMVVPYRDLEDGPEVLVVDSIDPSSGIRIVRWGELVSMILHDSQIKDIHKWSEMMGIEVLPSLEVLQEERRASNARLESVESLGLVISPMVQILSIPALVGLISSLAASEVSLDEGVSKKSLLQVGDTMVHALRLSILSVLSALIDLNLISVSTEFAGASADEDDDDDYYYEEEEDDE